MNRPSPKTITVIKKEFITPNMLRLTFNGESLKENIHWTPGCYIKLGIPDQGRPVTRTYTMRSFNEDKHTMEVDFAIHLPAGPATNWALNAEIGDQISFGGPGQLRINPAEGNQYIFAADMAALPAALSFMETLDENVKGHAILEVAEEEDKQELAIPEGITVQWLVQTKSEAKRNEQLEAIKELNPQEGNPNVFVAGELGQIREIKKYLQGLQDFSGTIQYISSYWKKGSNEEEHKQAKRLAS